MLRKITFLLVFNLISVSGFALNKADLNACLKDLAKGISHSAYSMSEGSETAERAALEAAIEAAEKSQKELRKIISKIETPEDFAKAEYVINAFSRKSKVNAHTASIARKMLKAKANFLTFNQDAKIHLSDAPASRAAAPQMLLSRNQKRLITIKVPVAEAIISFKDKSARRRVKNIEAIFKRHSCKIFSKHIDESTDDDFHNYYFSGKKYVVDAIVSHFKGSVIKSDLEARLKITTGGFWSGKNSMEFLISPKRTRSSSVMGDLSWYQSVIEKDPIKYLTNKHYGEISKLGKITKVANEKKLHLKNVIIEIRVSAKTDLKKNAVYFNELELGDVYVDAQ